MNVFPAPGGPWIGNTLSVDLVNLPSPLGILSMGFDDQTYNGSPLPLPLGPFGMPACLLNIAPQASVLATATAGTATVQIPIPNAAYLVGTVFYQQVFSPAPGANARGVLAGTSTRGVVGRAY